MNSGPAPDPNALRRDRPSDKDGWTTLPAEGFAGELPEWPMPRPTAGKDADPDMFELLAQRLSDLEGSTWRDVWRTPQAVIWHRNGWLLEVALYCRLMAYAQLGDMKAAAEARQWSDRLGLNPAAMLRNRWRVAPAADEPARTAPRATAGPARGRARDRFSVVPDADGE